MALLVVVLIVLLSALAQPRPPLWTSVGAVVAFEPGEWIYVDSMDVAIALRETTAYEDSPVSITPGVRVQVLGRRSVDERQPVATKVRVIPDAPPH
jgi:hypothetical protein